MGELYEEAPTTLGEELDSFLARLRASSTRSPRTLEFYERSARVWATFREKRVNTLQRRAVEGFITARATKHPRSAKNGLELLKRVLTEAKARGQRVNAAVLDIPAIKQRRGRALTVPQLYELASWFPRVRARASSCRRTGRGATTPLVQPHRRHARPPGQHVDCSGRALDESKGASCLPHANGGAAAS